MSIDHPRKQIEAILLGQWEKNGFTLPRTLVGQMIMLSMSFSTTAAVPLTDFTITLISETKSQIQKMHPILGLL